MRTSSTSSVLGEANHDSRRPCPLKARGQLYRERDEYVLRYLPGTALEDFVSLAMPVREEPWRWPRDLFPFFRQNLPEGYLLNVIREEFGPLLDGTDLSLPGLVGGTGIGRVSVTPEGIQPGIEMAPLEISHLLKAENTTARFAALVRQYARVAVSGVVPKFMPGTSAWRPCAAQKQLRIFAVWILPSQKPASLGRANPNTAVS
ncbi:HipA N-terminal domain-containing protein [Pseudomonas sp. TCU-HL1]|uniref:HipA N-terminal domain-containing protein n=1 Tax=Pseudomonas sp. TCU-HL1 TaxID=1856685 RepID=UPI001F34B13A|nr:HipA N-terminal domain-containing protein [Pseudomonas sp. TCU-HL1]